MLACFALIESSIKLLFSWVSHETRENVKRAHLIFCSLCICASRVLVTVPLVGSKSQVQL